MNGKIAKQLRKDAFTIASTQFNKTTSDKIMTGGQHIWERYSPKSIYKALKNAYYRNIAPKY